MTAISHYSAEIRRESASQYVVHISAKVSGGEWARPSFTLGPFRTGAFEGCDNCQAKLQGILQKLTPADGGLDLTYRVAAAPAGEREFIPLAVPEIPGTAAPGSVEVTLDVKPQGDVFPTLTQASEGQWTANMANMVSHVEFHAAAQTGLGPREWSDIAVVVMIVGGLLVRAIVTRRAKTA